ncbi:MAG: hypothetical protein ABI612_07235 [Betaproteobacteria bacterium]
MPIEISLGQLIVETAVRLLVLLIGVVAVVAIGSVMESNSMVFFALSSIYACFAFWVIWRSFRIPHRQRIIARRDGNELLIFYSSWRWRSVRIDLSSFRYVWLEHVLYKRGHVSWETEFGTSCTPGGGQGLKLQVGRESYEIQHAVHAAVRDFVDEAFETIECSRSSFWREIALTK